MIKATEIAMRTTPVNKTGLASLKAGLLAVIAGVVLAACGGGAETTDTPLPNGIGKTNNTPYTGPVAQDADVLKFAGTKKRALLTLNRKHFIHLHVRYRLHRASQPNPGSC